MNIASLQAQVDPWAGAAEATAGDRNDEKGRGPENCPSRAEQGREGEAGPDAVKRGSKPDDYGEAGQGNARQEGRHLCMLSC